VFRVGGLFFSPKLVLGAVLIPHYKAQFQAGHEEGPQAGGGKRSGRYRKRAAGGETGGRYTNRAAFCRAPCDRC
jgi:hypothetical protein